MLKIIALYLFFPYKQGDDIHFYCLMRFHYFIILNDHRHLCVNKMWVSRAAWCVMRRKEKKREREEKRCCSSLCITVFLCNISVLILFFRSELNSSLIHHRGKFNKDLELDGIFQDDKSWSSIRWISNVNRQETHRFRAGTGRKMPEIRHKTNFFIGVKLALENNWEKFMINYRYSHHIYMKSVQIRINLTKNRVKSTHKFQREHEIQPIYLMVLKIYLRSTVGNFCWIQSEDKASNLLFSVMKSH